MSYITVSVLLVVFFDEVMKYCASWSLLLFMIVWYLSQVALHLLSEKEKNDLAQLVSTMVSYSITHRSIKSDPLPSNLGHQAADVSELSFDPPISGFINFQV